MRQNAHFVLEPIGNIWSSFIGTPSSCTAWDAQEAYTLTALGFVPVSKHLPTQGAFLCSFQESEAPSKPSVRRIACIAAERNTLPESRPNKLSRGKFSSCTLSLNEAKTSRMGFQGFQYYLRCPSETIGVDKLPILLHGNRAGQNSCVRQLLQEAACLLYRVCVSRVHRCSVCCINYCRRQTEKY